MNGSVEPLLHVPREDLVALDEVGECAVLRGVLGGDLPEDDDLGEDLLPVSGQYLERNVSGAEGSGDGVEGLAGQDDASGDVVGAHVRDVLGRQCPWQ